MQERQLLLHFLVCILLIGGSQWVMAQDASKQTRTKVIQKTTPIAKHLTKLVSPKPRVHQQKAMSKPTRRAIRKFTPLAGTNKVQYTKQQFERISLEEQEILKKELDMAGYKLVLVDAPQVEKPEFAEQAPVKQALTKFVVNDEKGLFLKKSKAKIQKQAQIKRDISELKKMKVAKKGENIFQKATKMNKRFIDKGISARAQVVDIKGKHIIQLTKKEDNNFFIK